jgi:hypothetical protein
MAILDFVMVQSSLKDMILGSLDALVSKLGNTAL